MQTFLFVTAAILFSWAFAAAQTSVSTTSLELTILVQGDTARLPDFVQSLRREFSERGLTVKLAERGGEYEYNIVLAQESSLGGAAAAVIVLDRNCGFLTSVVRSGRMSGKGALNASAKETREEDCHS